MSRPVVLLSFVAIGGLAACWTDQPQINPAPYDAGIGADTSRPPPDASEDGPAPTEAGPVRRQVLRRSLYGNLQHTMNLMFDGDFEWSAQQGQPGWVGIGQNGVVDLSIVTGGLCRSGLRCGRIDNTTSAMGYGIGPTHSGIDLSVWVKVPGTDCNVVGVYLAGRMTGHTVEFVFPETNEPGPNDDGWCRFHTVRPRMDEAPIVTVDGDSVPSGQWALVDDVELLPADGLSPLRAEVRPVPPRVRERVAKAIEWIHKHQPFPVPFRRAAP